MNEIWCNGQWLPADNFPASAGDRGAFLGLGLFETMLAINGAPVFADRHLNRLRMSCEKFGWPLDLSDFPEAAVELLVRNSLTTGRARLRLMVTAGSGPLNDLTTGVDRLVWLASFPAVEPPESVAVCLSPWPRNERSPLAGLKTASYAENLVALDHARRLGFDETIFTNTNGHLCEAATANLFVVRNSILLTPSLDSGCLPGIGREVICELASAHGITLEERPLLPADLLAADESFLTSAIRGPVAVSRFGDREFSPGPVTREMRRLWNVAIGL